MIVLLCGLRILAEVSFVLSQFTRLMDRQTDGRLYPGYIALHNMQRGNKNGPNFVLANAYPTQFKKLYFYTYSCK